MKIALILIFLVLSSTLYANSDESKFSVFSKSFTDSYDPLMCSHNMLGLIESFEEKGISNHDTYIVHVRALNAPFASVKAYAARGGFSEWSFHAFMIKDGVVFDLDFGNSPRLVGVKEYLKLMFFVSHERAQRLLFQIKPAQDYAPVDFDGSMNSRLYPLKNLSLESFDYLLSI